MLKMNEWDAINWRFNIARDYIISPDKDFRECIIYSKAGGDEAIFKNCREEYGDAKLKVFKSKESFLNEQLSVMFILIYSLHP